MIAKILIVDSAPAASQAALARHGGAGHSANYAAALRLHAAGIVDGLDCFTLSAGDHETLPQGLDFADFHGIVWTGSPLNAYDGSALVQHQIDIARAAFDSGVPGFGSCWGMQVMSTALGGRVHLHPKGYEFGLARQITVNAAGQSHPIYQGKPVVFDALCSHQDEVCTLPPGAINLAGNDHTANQAMICEDGTRSFWGVQYHPEYDLNQMAALFSRAAKRMVGDGFVRHPDEARSLAEDFRALHQDPDRRDVAWRYGIGPDVSDRSRHGTELANWLRVKVAPRA